MTIGYWRGMRITDVLAVMPVDDYESSVGFYERLFDREADNVPMPSCHDPSTVRAEGQFTVTSFSPAPITPSVAITTGVAVGVATMEKVFTGDVDGRSATLFTSAFDPAAGAGTYVAMESFEGSLSGASGTFNFAHSATTTGADRTSTFFVIVPGSGTGGLVGITGSGELAIDPDGAHRIAFDYELA